MNRHGLMTVATMLLGLTAFGCKPAPLDSQLYESGKQSPYADKPIDLVIAHENYKQVVQTYVAFKKNQGRLVREEYVKDGVDTKQIKALMEKHYKEKVTPRHTFLVGNRQQIPAFPGVEEGEWSDWPYQEWPDSKLPPVSLGRLPVNTSVEFSAWASKVLTRSKQKIGFKDILLAAGAEEQAGECLGAMEDVAETLKPLTDVTLHKVFRCLDAKPEDVYAALKKDLGLIFYEGSGSEDGMTGLPFLRSHIAQLSQKTFPILLDMAPSQTAWGNGQKRSFAEDMLFAADKGAVGVVGSTGRVRDEAFMLSIANVLVTSHKAGSGLGNHLNEIGHVILAAKLRSHESDRMRYQFFGDPALTLWAGYSGTIGSTDQQNQPTGNDQTATGYKVHAYLDENDMMYFSVKEGSQALRYCEGDQASCKDDSKFSPLKKVDTDKGFDFYQWKATPKAGWQMRLRSGTDEQGLRLDPR